MKTKAVVGFVAFCLAAAVMTFGQTGGKKSSTKGTGTAMSAQPDAFMGTWKLNESKSKIPAGAAKNSTVTYEAAGDQIKVTIDGTDASGNAMHNEWIGKTDGKDYPVTGDAASDMRSVKMINKHTATFAVKKDGKTTASGRIVVAADGKTRTVTANSTDPKTGKKTTSTAVYDKQ